jgi:hypothetical protein
MYGPHKTLHHTKTPIGHLIKFLIKYNDNKTLEEMAYHFLNIYNWIQNNTIDNGSFNIFWTNPRVIEAQIQQLLNLNTDNTLTMQKNAPLF